MKLDRKVVEAFELMWGKFPEPVTLVHKSREVIAVNSACASFGRNPGVKCNEQGPAEAHSGCLANRALSSQEATYKSMILGDKHIISYWLPIEGYPDYFIHFGVGVTIDY